MMDHMLRFASEDAARAALPAYCADGQWDGSRTIPGVSIITAEAVWDGEALVSPEAVLPGWWIVVSLDAVSAALRDLPGGACRFVADGDAASRGEPWWVYLAPDLDVGLLATARVSPVFAGALYQMGL